MPDMKKEQEREELHRAIWAIADALRGSVDGWDFKNYVLGTMFYRYISENLTAYINEGEQEAGTADFDYAKMTDTDAEEAREGLIEEKGFFILPSELFCNVRKAAKSDKATFIDRDGNPKSVKENLNEFLELIFRHIEDSAKGSTSESDFAGLFDDFDVNSNKLGATVAKRNSKLSSLLDGIAEMNLGNVKDHDIDAFGDAYEFLMSMYASNAGKSGGEFFTPADVSELLTRLGTVGKTEINKVYDPACGSGSLLLKAEKVLGHDAVRNGFFGQEINITTYNLCRINMFLHDVGFDKFNIACEDTLTAPQHWDDEPFELIVSNPPYSIKWAGDANPLLINDPRYSPAGVLAPKSAADFAFIMHALSWLAANGTAAIVCFPGIMYRGGAEQKIRKYLIDNNFVDCVIQLPANLFFGTSIATCIMVLKKNKTDDKTLFIDATKECIKVTKNNRLTIGNIKTIVNAFTRREETPHFSHLATYNEIVENGYNLSVITYVEAEDIREAIDIAKLNAEIREIAKKEIILRSRIQNVIFDKLPSTIGKKTIQLRNIVDFKNGKAHEKEITDKGKYIVVNSKFISTNGAIKKYTNNQMSPVFKDDILMVMSDLPNGKALAKTFFVEQNNCYTLNQRICALSVKDKNVFLPKFLFYYLNRNPQLTKYDNGADQTNLKKDDILNIYIPLFSIEEQSGIIEILDTYWSLCKYLSDEVDCYNKEIDFFYQKVFTI